MDHRHVSRRQALVLVEIRWRDDQSASGLMYNLSHDGMFVVSDVDLEMNTCIDVVLQPESESPIRIPGLVVHHNNNGFGILFQQLDNAAHAFVEKYLG